MMDSAAEERCNRIRAALFAYAYEVMHHSMIPDNEYDSLCRRINPEVQTGSPALDEFFRTEFHPDTGMWIHRHPDLPGIASLYHRLNPKTAHHTAKSSKKLRPVVWEPPNPFVPKLFGTCVTGRYLWLDLSLMFNCSEGKEVATCVQGGMISLLFNWEFEIPDPKSSYHFDKIIRIPYEDWWGQYFAEGMEDHRKYADWIKTRVAIKGAG